MKIDPWLREISFRLMYLQKFSVFIGSFALGLALMVPIHADQTYAKLKAGPMIGHVSMAEALIWVQTTGPSEVHIRYWDKKNSAALRMTAVVQTEKETAFVAKCIADEVQSDSSYNYEVWIDGEKVTPRFRDGFRNGDAIPLSFSTAKNWRFRENGHQIFDFTIGCNSFL